MKQIKTRIVHHKFTDEGAKGKWKVGQGDINYWYVIETENHLEGVCLEFLAAKREFSIVLSFDNLVSFLDVLTTRNPYLKDVLGRLIRESPDKGLRRIE